VDFAPPVLQTGDEHSPAAGNLEPYHSTRTAPLSARRERAIPLGKYVETDRQPDLPRHAGNDPSSVQSCCDQIDRYRTRQSRRCLAESPSQKASDQIAQI